MQPVLTQVPPTSFRSIKATVLPAAVSRPASGGPAWPAPMMIASNARVMTRASQSGVDQQRAADGDRILDQSGGGVAAEGCGQPPARGRPAERADYRPDDAEPEPDPERCQAVTDRRPAKPTT